ncbi:MMPL family transporter [Antrihabitans cavernicola]|uniref:MMPL family transporter n=1 Tax=Antrihabitans cavernicola TaxID=2495913 RepID=A0A5A7S3T6_9NOCA|nr:MMPL family transporter [Spelaeibacter cavernicola]KAA0016313.1 MMPL family transporter [Spelaeibacter cavernicola]
MFAKWGNFVYHLRYTVIGVMVAGLLALGAYGLGLENHLSQSGWDDPGSESSRAAQLTDATYGRDHTSDVVAIYTAPAGKTIDDPTFSAAVTDSLNSLPKDHPDQIDKVNISAFKSDSGQQTAAAADKSRQHGIASIAIKGNTDTEQAQNFRVVKNAFQIPGVDVQLAGLQPVAGTLNDTMAEDVQRMEVLAIPAVGVLLFFIFGGVVAAALPLICGGLTVIGAWGIVRLITNFTEVNSFVSPVVSLIGLGLAIDYGLFIVSRFREELAEGHRTRDAVRRSVMTAGRTVIFSATMIVASLGGLLLFPQGFLKSVAYGAIATVSLAALCAVTVLPAILGILGPRVDALGLKRFRKTKTSEEIENSIWGKLTRWVMKHPLKVAIPIIVGLLLLIIPVNSIQFGGINEKYLPPDNPTRAAQQEFDQLFPGLRTEPIKLVVQTKSAAQINTVIKEASNAPGLVEKFSIDKPGFDSGVWTLKAGLVDRNNGKPAIDYLRSMPKPDGATVSVTGTPAIEQDSITALLDRMPLMIALVILSTTLLMFLTFGSLVLPIKAALMSALGLGSTLGILTWIFVDGHGSGLLNFTPGPIMSPVLVLIISIIYGLSTDYEVFLLSRMVEARALGASTTEAVRVGTAHTGRIITAAALILIVVTGAFGFSQLVMMQYIAYGMIAALIIDATLIRMFLVPATMKLLGDDCWWAPAWMKRIQQRIGLGEPILDERQMPTDIPELVTAGAPPAPPVRSHPGHLAPPNNPVRTEEPLTTAIPRVEAPHRYHPDEKPAPARPRPPAPPRRPVANGTEQPNGTRNGNHQNGIHQNGGVPNGAARVQPPQNLPPARPTIPEVDVPRPEPTPSRGIDDWLADLRKNQTEQPTPPAPTQEPEADDDGGRHHKSADRPALSVRELLNRQKPE